MGGLPSTRLAGRSPNQLFIDMACDARIFQEMARTPDEALLFKGSKRADRLRATAKKLKRDEARREFKRNRMTHDKEPS